MHLRAGRSWNGWVAVVATYALALQLVFGNPLQNHAAGADLPQTLCSGGLPAKPGPAPLNHLPDCCQHGCCALASLWIAPPQADLPRPEAEWFAEASGRPGLAIPRRLAGDPRSTRGPPPAA
ncbi:MAG TPA: hypothetical protein VH414_21290 [Lichenihabitans sp.]|nr:hypothetical protein [Lichenihabitans sp.]